MMPYNRLGSGISAAAASGGATPSPPGTPRSPKRQSPRFPRRAARTPPPRTLPERVSYMLLSILLRRQAVFLFAPLVYVAVMLLYMGTVAIDSVPLIISRPAPGSVYRSPQLYQRLRADMDADNSSDAFATVWKHAYRGGGWKPCINMTSNGASHEDPPSPASSTTASTRRLLLHQVRGRRC